MEQIQVRKHRRKQETNPPDDLPDISNELGEEALKMIVKINEELGDG